MVLRLAFLPLSRSLEALDRHLAVLQDTGAPVLVITTRVGGDYLAGQLRIADPTRMAILDNSSPVPPKPVPGVRIEHVAGPHLLELLALRAQRLVQSHLKGSPHVVYYDADSLARHVPADVAVQVTLAAAAATSPATFTDIVVHDFARLPAPLRAAYDEVATRRLAIDAPARP